MGENMINRLNMACLALVVSAFGCTGAPHPKVSSVMFTPFCDPHGFGNNVTKRTFFLFLIKNKADPNSAPLMPGVAPGLIEPTCDEIQSNATPGTPLFDEPAYTWIGEPMKLWNGRPVTFGTYAQHKWTIEAGIEGDDLVAGFHLTGGIPGGVYTLWFNDLAALISTGERVVITATPFGELDGSDSRFIADGNGEIVIKNQRRKNAGIVIGAKGFSIATHLDGLTYGPVASPSFLVRANDPAQLTGQTTFDVAWDFVDAQ